MTVYAFVLISFLTSGIYFLVTYENVNKTQKDIIDKLVGRWVANQKYQLDGKTIVFNYEIVIDNKKKIIFQRPFVRTLWNSNAYPKTTISKPMKYSYWVEGKSLDKFLILFKEADGFGYHANIKNETLTLTNASQAPQQLILKRATSENN